jgi:protein ImuB
MRRILSAWSPNWPITSWRRRNPGSGARAEPFALVESVKGARRLAAVDARAEAEGLWAGQKLADAMALQPNLKTADHDPEADLQSLARLADWCVRFSPAVAVDAPDGLFLDVTGAEALWGGEAALLDDFAARMAKADVPVRAAIADTAGAAWAIARYGDGRGVLPSGEAGRLEPLPVAALRLAPETEATLKRLGLKTIGAVLDLPRDQLVRRFGAGLLLRLDQAVGMAEEALAYRRPPTPWFEHRALAEPITVLDDLVRVLSDAAAALCVRLAGEGKGGRRFEAVFHRADGEAFPIRIGTALPSRDAARLVKLFAPRLETIDPGFGVEAVTLRAGRVEPLAERQLSSEAADEGDGVALLVDRLSNRLGEDRVWRAAPHESWTPERAVVRAPAMSKTGGSWDPERPRPLRLFARPEPVEAIAPVPDDPPVRFTWRGVPRRVRRAEGPERIAQEWWRDAACEPGPDRVRDYYRVEDEEGARFWLFRAGLYAPGRPARWFVHGLFG